MCKFFKSLSLCMSRVPRPATCLCTVVNNTLFHFLFRFLPCLCQFSPILVTLKRNIYVLSIIFEQPSYVNLCTKSWMTCITSYTVHSIYLHSVPTTNIDYSPGRDLGVLMNDIIVICEPYCRQRSSLLHCRLWQCYQCQFFVIPYNIR